MSLHFGALVRRRRLENGLTIDEVAKIVGVSRPTICAVEHAREPRMQAPLLLSLAAVFEIDLQPFVNARLIQDVRAYKAGKTEREIARLEASIRALKESP